MTDQSQPTSEQTPDAPKVADPSLFSQAARLSMLPIREGGGWQAIAPAKVNLYLHVTGRRDDGYHELDSLMVFAGVGDLLTLKPPEKGAKALSLSLEGPMAAHLDQELTNPKNNPENNIVLQAAQALARHFDRPAEAAITLYKALPVAAGIGGGSADAAATLHGLCALWGVGLAHNEMAALALPLGADVPVCLESQARNVSGIGDVLKNPPFLPGVYMVLVNPGVAVSTPAVFKKLADERGNKSYTTANPITEAPGSFDNFVNLLEQRQNDLEAPAIALAPAIADVLAALRQTENCALARMSGSGATCFGLFADPDSADATAEELKQHHPDWWVAAAPMRRF